MIDINQLSELVKNQGFADLHEFAKIRLSAWLKRQAGESFFPWQKKQFDDLLETLKPEIVFPFRDFPEKRAQTYTEKERASLKNALDRFALGLEGYALQEASAYFREQKAHNQMIASFYETKYQAVLEQATQNFDSYPFALLEKENDLQMWEEALLSYKNYGEDLENIAALWNI